MAYERSVGFASLQNSGRSISGILARPLPKGAGLRQGLLVSDTAILNDTRNAQISQTLSAVKTEGSPAPNFSASAITSADNPSVTVTKSFVLHQNNFNLIYKTIPKILHKGAGCDSSLPNFHQIIISHLVLTEAQSLFSHCPKINIRAAGATTIIHYSSFIIFTTAPQRLSHLL